MKTINSLNRDRKSTPVRNEKAPTTTQRLIKKAYPKYSNIPAEYHGMFNRIPSQKKIIDGYWSSLQFYKQREAHHQEAASWYFNHMREMEAKAGKHLDLAEVAHANYMHYLDLLGMAYLAKAEKSRGVCRE